MSTRSSPLPTVRRRRSARALYTSIAAWNRLTVPLVPLVAESAIGLDADEGGAGGRGVGGHTGVKHHLGVCRCQARMVRGALCAVASDATAHRVPRTLLSPTPDLLTDLRTRAAYSEGAGIHRIVPTAVAVPRGVEELQGWCAGRPTAAGTSCREGRGAAW